MADRAHATGRWFLEVDGRRWPTTYAWNGTIPRDSGSPPEGGWRRTAVGGDAYRRATGSAPGRWSGLDEPARVRTDRHRGAVAHGGRSGNLLG